MRLIEFQTTGRHGSIVYVNPEQVEFIKRESDAAVQLFFYSGSMLFVLGSMESVREKLLDDKA